MSTSAIMEHRRGYLCRFWAKNTEFQYFFKGLTASDGLTDRPPGDDMLTSMHVEVQD